MPEIDRYSDVLSPEIRSAWPIVATAVKRLRGSLVGGTALTLTLRHRESYDLDYMVSTTFSGKHLFQKLTKTSHLPCDAIQEETDSMHAQVGGVMVQVFRQPYRGSNPGHVKQLQKPATIDGMRVASLPDLLATKLDVIMYRPKPRDYIDIAAIDQSGVYTIEDGLRFHAERYGIPLHSSDLDDILRLLQNPGQLAPDRVFGASQQETLEYLKNRATEARRALGALRAPPLTPRDNDPPDRPSASRARSRCAAWMPVSRAHCRLPRGHKGHHRSR